MRRLTKAERENGIGYKSLLIAKDGYGEIRRVRSPSMLSLWDFDSCTWTLNAHEEPSEANAAGVYVAFDAQTARQHFGKLCKVALSGKVIIYENGARGAFARLLEVEQCKSER